MPEQYVVRDGTLYINNVQKDAEGTYTCLGLGVSGTVLFEADATLRVIGEWTRSRPLRLSAGQSRLLRLTLTGVRIDSGCVSQS